jgi:hypothetical protein
LFEAVVVTTHFFYAHLSQNKDFEDKCSTKPMLTAASTG